MAHHGPLLTSGFSLLSIYGPSQNIRSLNSWHLLHGNRSYLFDQIPDTPYSSLRRSSGLPIPLIFKRLFEWFAFVEEILDRIALEIDHVWIHAHIPHHHSLSAELVAHVDR